MTRPIDEILEEQKAYYRARADEYDEWFYRRGRYDRGEPHNSDWFREVGEIEAALASLGPLGDVLEIAAGTGIWTTRLCEAAKNVVALDSSREVLNLNREKNKSDKILFECADIFEWQAPQKFDLVFFSLWLSHVPEEKFELFWSVVDSQLKPGGRWFLIDSLPDEFSRAYDHTITDKNDIAHRKLNDGRQFQVVKRFYEPEKLSERLRGLGWENKIRTTQRFFLFGSGKKSR